MKRIYSSAVHRMIAFISTRANAHSYRRNAEHSLNPGMNKRAGHALPGKWSQFFERMRNYSDREIVDLWSGGENRRENPMENLGCAGERIARATGEGE